MKKSTPELERPDDFFLPEKNSNKTVGFLLLFLAFFFTLHNPQFEFPTPIEPASIGTPAPLKSPALETNHAVKLVSRMQSALKAANGGGDNELDTPQSKHIAHVNTQRNLLKLRLTYQTFSHSHHQRFYKDATQPRAPPANLA